MALLLVSGLFFFWLESPEQRAQFISVPKDVCGVLPSFMCDWVFLTSTDADHKPFNPLSSLMKGDKKEPGKAADKALKPPVKPELDAAAKEKLAYIKLSYSGQAATKLVQGQSFYKNILKDIIAAKPAIKNTLGRYKDKLESVRYEDNPPDPLISQKYLEGFLDLDDSDLDALSASHSKILKNLPEKAPEGLYANDGIVYVGGGKFNWLTLLSVRALRASGCQLPVEILIPTLDEYELGLCSRIFPAMNAKCIYMPTALYGSDVEFASGLKFKGYQYKCLAILLSSFENVLFLDSDNIVTYAPDHLLESEPFTSSGLVVWPDYWRRTTSPSFFHIAGVDVSQTELSPIYVEKWAFYQDQEMPRDKDWYSEIPFHERLGAIPDPSSESGQLLISKKTHLKALLLALYYNSYGPEFYYPMFSQGAKGEGDKETFLAATVVLKKSFYQVGKFLIALGNHKNGGFKGHGMGQVDPIKDYELGLKRKEIAANYKGKKLVEQMDKIDAPKILFVHANFPKLDPWELKQAGETVDTTGRHRLYGYSMRARTGTDFESDIWQHMHTLLCEANLDIDHFKHIPRDELCAEIVAQMEFLKESASKLE